MPPTLPPGSVLWPPWEQPGARLRPEQWQFALHASRPLTADELDRLIRLNAALGRAAIVLARPSSWPAVRPPWYNVDLSQTLKQPHDKTYLDNLQFPGAGVGVGVEAPQKPSLPPWWEGWLPAAAILFTLLLLIARATERCLSNKLKRRRAMRAARAPLTEEWPTPNVRATAAAEPRGSPSTDPRTTRPTVEMPPPPPYSEIANSENRPNVRDIDGLLGFTRAERASFGRRNRNRRFTDDNVDLSTSFRFRNFEELCRIRQMLKRNRELQPPPSYSSVILNEAPPYSSVILNEAPPYSSVVFNNNESPSVHFTNNGQRVNNLANLNPANVNLANPENIEPEISRVNNNIQGAPVNFINVQAYENVHQGASVNFNANSQGVTVNSTNMNPSQNLTQIQSAPSYDSITRHVAYVTNYDETLTAQDVAQGMADAFEDDHEVLPDKRAYERHFVPEPEANAGSKSLAITESMLANSDILKRHRKYDDPVAMRRNLEREVEALADQERDEIVTFGDIADEEVIRDIDERDVALRDETAIELDNEINAEYEAMEQDDIGVEIAGANNFDDDAKRALDFAETQIDDKHNPRV